MFISSNPSPLPLFSLHAPLPLHASHHRLEPDPLVQLPAPLGRADRPALHDAGLGVGIRGARAAAGSVGQLAQICLATVLDVSPHHPGRIRTCQCPEV